MTDLPGARAHGSDPDRGPRHPRPGRARGDAGCPARGVPPARAGGVRLRGRTAADRARADDLAAVHRRADDRRARAPARATACSRSAPARATRRRSSAASRARSTRSSATRSSPTRRRERLATARLRQRRTCCHGDGTLGWPEHAPYDAIVVAAGGPTVPRRCSSSSRRAAGSSSRSARAATLQTPRARDSGGGRQPSRARTSATCASCR